MAEQLYGLIGYPLSHSFSKGYFTEKFRKENISNCSYENFPLEKIEEIIHLFQQHSNLKGLNVTIPYKEAVISFLDQLNDEAAVVGAVNTIRWKDRKTTGFNTDIYGFEHSLMPLLKPWHKQALVLGTGGASKAVVHVLKKLRIDYQYVSRKEGLGNLSYNDLTKEIIDAHTLIINTTPIGMFPKADVAPNLPYDAIGEKHLLYDLVYNPEETVFLNKGKMNGANIKNGLEMLHLQAERAWAIWNDIRP